MKTPQDLLWEGEFGDEYISRNQGQKLIMANTHFFMNVLWKVHGVRSVLEFGANIGLNLHAIMKIFPSIVDYSAVEINEKAVKTLRETLPSVKVYHQSILDFTCDSQKDFVFTKGVLIHIHPDFLQEVYEKLYSSSRKYICIAEYYNPKPVEIPYRGQTDVLFKRDFAGEILDKYPDLNLVDYGFAYHRDRLCPLDDITWFLLKKS